MLPHACQGQQELKEILYHGIIQISTSEWASHICASEKEWWANFWRVNRESQFDTYPTPRVDDPTMQNPSPHNLYQYLYIIHQPSPSRFLEAWLSRWMHTVHCWTLPVKSHLGQHKYPPTSDLTWGHWQVPVAKGMCHKGTYVLPLATSSL